MDGMGKKIMIIDDNEDICSSMQRALKQKQYNTAICYEYNAVMGKLAKEQPDLILLDVFIGEHSGLSLLKDIKAQHPKIPIIIMTASTDVSLVVDAMKQGAENFVTKPINIDQLDVMMQKAFEDFSLKVEVQHLRKNEEERFLAEYKIIGESSKIKDIKATAEKFAQSSTTTVLIYGESGTGKELIANTIHKRSTRANKPFVAINCGAIPKDLAESELFGHEKGAFTGADKTKIGKFELADGGTLFLDEVGELNKDLQTKLLRVLQERRFYRIGGTKEVFVDIRIIAATNKKLEKMVEDGEFRDDLYYRLNVASLEMPPLRERKEDIVLISYAFLEDLSKKNKKPLLGVSPDARRILENHPWYGNVRELRSVLESVAITIENNVIVPEDLKFLSRSLRKNIDVHQGDFSMHLPDQGIQMEFVVKELITKTMELSSGNQSQAAKMLGISRSQLRYQLERHQIELQKNMGLD